MDLNHPPLSASCVRALNDKLYEKRKTGALEIERMIKEFVGLNNSAQVKRTLDTLGSDFALSHNSNMRKGGLIGLASAAIALGKDAPMYTDALVKPVLPCFHDSDSRVRYYGCESLYNITKVTREAILPYFNDIFDGLSHLAADADQNVRSGSELLNKLLKDIVIESATFDLEAFIPLLRERVYVKNQFCRQFILSWTLTLLSVPDTDLMVSLPDILDGFFLILSDDLPEIRRMCEAVLAEFLNSILKSPGRCDFPSIINILIIHSQSSDDVIKLSALVWLRNIIPLTGRCLLPFISGLLTAVLPCLAQEDQHRKDICDAARTINDSLMTLIEEKCKVKPGSSNSEAVTNSETSQEESEKQGYPRDLDMLSVVNVLILNATHKSMQTRITTLNWIHHFYRHMPDSFMTYMKATFEVLIKTLSDPSDEVVLLDLNVLADISSRPIEMSQYTDDDKYLQNIPQKARQELSSLNSTNGCFVYFMVSLLELFSNNNKILDTRGSFIIRQMCVLLNSEDVFRSMSLIIVHEQDLRFASLMVQTLNHILLTSTELHELRRKLRRLDSPQSCALFCCLYRAWCHNPVCAVSLCYLTQSYRHAYNFVFLLGEIELDAATLVEIDKLIQLIESPIFVFLRLQLLEPGRHAWLVRSLYGLLMLLPQTDAFHCLRRRLQCIPHLQLSPETSTTQQEQSGPLVDFDELEKHFARLQQSSRSQKLASQTKKGS